MEGARESERGMKRYGERERVAAEEDDHPPPEERQNCVQGYLAHKKPPIPLGPPEGPRHIPTVGS